jgi:cyanophycin synthetase
VKEYLWPKEFGESVVKKAYGNKLCCYTIALEAWRRGLDVTLLDSSYKNFKVASKEKEVVFNRSSSEMNTLSARRLVSNKQKARELLLSAGVPVSAGKMFEVNEGFDALIKYAEEVGYPLVIKPVYGSLGVGVFTNIGKQEDLESHCYHLVNDLGKRKLLLEQHILGDDYRAYVVGDKVSAVVKRLPANVTGDGKSTVAELIDGKNLIRKKNPFLSKGLIKIDREVLSYVESVGLSLNSIVEEGVNLKLRGKANASAGGDVVDVTDTVCNEMKEISLKAIQAIPGLYQGG